MEQVCIILTTTNLKEIAEQLAQELVLSDLAACVQIDEVKSIFKWDGKIDNEKEFRLMIKAKSSNYQQIEQAIIAIHNYQLPQIIKFNITDGFQPYLDWVTGTFKK
ncbi:divalent-cation tolerance protein CutA [Candidatus Trichorickettsia mobilis]|uniref:divalent-cation tolerance protein CutA n=1 Tax=Candidatus Trichorickettsia mobilis TaxID=1346319 RepID=UPI00292DDA5D|nr:divalent cation tolerance protein CutA [Candidatus Trichorickettsia mobilis]